MLDTDSVEGDDTLCHLVWLWTLHPLFPELRNYRHHIFSFRTNSFKIYACLSVVSYEVSMFPWCSVLVAVRGQLEVIGSPLLLRGHRIPAQVLRLGDQCACCWAISLALRMCLLPKSLGCFHLMDSQTLWHFSHELWSSIAISHKFLWPVECLMYTSYEFLNVIIVP